MRPPKKLGRCCDGDGWVSAGEGLEGVVGLAGDEGRAGVEYEREPRLPPLPARANTLAVSVSSNETSATPTRIKRARDVIGHASNRILRYGSTSPSLPCREGSPHSRRLGGRAADP